MALDGRFHWYSGHGHTVHVDLTTGGRGSIQLKLPKSVKILVVHKWNDTHHHFTYGTFVPATTYTHIRTYICICIHVHFVLSEGMYVRTYVHMYSIVHMYVCTVCTCFLD